MFPAMRPLAEALRAIRYTGRISPECVFRPDFETAIRSALSGNRTYSASCKAIPSTVARMYRQER